MCDKSEIKKENEKKTKKRWTDKETEIFLDLLLEKQVFKVLDGKKFRNKEVFSSLEQEMKSKGFERDAAQLAVKFKNLKAEFGKIKMHNKVSGADRRTMPLEEKLSLLFDTRPRESFQTIGIESSGEGLAEPEMDDEIEIVMLQEATMQAHEESAEAEWTMSSVQNVEIVEMANNDEQAASSNMEQDPTDPQPGPSNKNVINKEAGGKGRKRKTSGVDLIGATKMFIQAQKDLFERETEREERMMDKEHDFLRELYKKN